MEKGFSAGKILLVLAATALLAGCAGSPSSRFYTLTPLGAPQAPPGAAASHLAVNIEPVDIPDYLDRPQIVTREGNNEVKVAEFDRWAGSLGENISDVLAEDLGQLLGSDGVVVNNGALVGKPDYVVSMRVLRLDCLPGDRVLLKAQWKVASGDGKKERTRVSTIAEKVSDRQYETLVAAVNRALDRVSREIATEIPLH